MSLAIVFRPEAKADVLAAYDWYEEQQSGLGSVFVDALSGLLDQVRTMPQMYPVVLRDARRGKLRKFPTLFNMEHTDRIEVIAVFHGSRDPKRWQERVN